MNKSGDVSLSGADLNENWKCVYMFVFSFRLVYMLSTFG